MTNLSTSTKPSYVTPPKESEHATVIEFLTQRFPRITRQIWEQRIISGKVHFNCGEKVSLSTPYQPLRRICYYREVPSEPIVPFTEKIIFENEQFFIVDKPHFLQIHPAGKFVNETLITRLAKLTGHTDLCAAHRLDRHTAGLVLCVKQKKFRAAYQKMFMNGAVTKNYLARGTVPCSEQTEWHVRNFLEPYDEHFRMQSLSNKEPNSYSIIKLISVTNGIGLYHLQPVTGRKHQLRVHMCDIGSSIINDPIYPTYNKNEQPDNYSRPLQLLAHSLEFIDPISHEPVSFTTTQTLDSST